MVNERLSREWIEQNKHTVSWQLHLERYTFAEDLLTDKFILDIACGTGYGSEILAKSNRVIGVDIDAEAIKEAKSNAQNIEFVHAGYQDVAVPKDIDTIVSLETIEHLPDPSDFIRFCYESLPSKGTLVISAPISYTSDLNAFHLTDFTEESFRAMIESHGFVPTDKQLHQSQNMLDGENTSKLSTAEYLKLIGQYVTKPNRIWNRIKDLSKNGLTIKYLLAVYTKK